MPSNPTELYQVWHKTCHQAPSAACLHYPDGHCLTRNELQVAVNMAYSEIATLKQSKGIIAFQCEDLAQWIAIFLAIQNAGSIALPIDLDYPEHLALQLCENLGVAASYLKGTDWKQHTNARTFRKRDLAIAKLTSGSTGIPKPLLFTASQMLADGQHVCEGMGITSEDLNFASFPIGHSYGLGNLLMPLLMQGTAIAVGSPHPFPHPLANEIATLKPTIWPSIPVVLHAMVRAEVDAEKFRSLRTIISAGAPLNASTAQAFRQHYCHHIHNFYGSSETGGIAYDVTGEATLVGRGIGKPLPGVEVTISSTGRIKITSHACQTYGRKGGRKTILLEDRGRLNEFREIVIVGRNRSVLKVGSRRVNAAEIERAILEVEHVYKVMVFLLEGNRPTLVAAVEGNAEVADIQQVLLRKLSHWKIPKFIRVYSKLPHTARGKLNRQRIMQELSTR
jgi:long-chain acyl-CoA synthetase